MSKVFVSAIGVIALVACSHEQPAEQSRETVRAQTMIVQRASVDSLRTFNGVVRSVNVSPLAAKVMGNVLRVHVREGDRVREGQLLVEIDARDTTAQMNAASSALSAAEANAALAEATFRRFDALRARGSVSAQEFDDVKARRDAAIADVQRAKAMRAQANAYRDDANVRAPMDGIVTARFVDPGAQAAPAMLLLTIEDASAYRVEVMVPEDVMVRVGDAVRVDGVAARVTRVQPSVDVATRSALVQVERSAGAAPAESRAPSPASIDGGEGAAGPAGDGAGAPLRSGAFVRVAFSTGNREILRVPEQAIIRNGALTSVFVLDANNVARMRLITLGDSNEVLSGLAAGERIVLDATNVRDGVQVS